VEWIFGIIGVFVVALSIAVLVFTHERNKNPAATPIKWEAAAVGVAVLAGIGGALLAVASLIGNENNPSTGAEPTMTVTVTPIASPPTKPKITISAVEWRDDAKDPGMYRAKGHADLQKGQVVYLFNAQVQPDGTTGPLFPDLGPCPTDGSGNWACDVGFAGAPKDRGLRFRIFAMVLDDENAYETVKKREGFLGENHGYPDPAGTPHVQGEQTVADLDLTRPL
jgi:hypothetical protein